MVLINLIHSSLKTRDIYINIRWLRVIRYTNGYI